MSEPFGNRHHHKGYLLKSNAEYRFALLLDRLMEAEGDGAVFGWKYEPKPFWFKGIKQGTVSYKADFRVVWESGEEVYYEIKAGYMCQKDITKYKRMASRHPDIKLVLVVTKIPKRGKYKNYIDSAKKYVHHVWEVGEDYKRFGIRI